MAECDAPVPPIAAGGCAPAVAGMTGLCLTDGSPILIWSSAPSCPPGTPGVVNGWTNLRTGVYTAGAIPADAGACGETADFEVVRWCALDADGEPLADLLVEYEYDEETRAIVGSRILNVDGTPYSGPAYASIGRCDDETLINHTSVRECRNGTIHIVTRAIAENNTIVEIEAVDTAEPCGQPQIAVELECIDSVLYQITFLNGVESARVVIGDCPDALDFEQVRVCDQATGTVHIVTTSFDEVGASVVVSDVDTAEPCPTASTIEEEVVCVGDCQPAIRRVEIAADGTETVTYIGADGVDLTATAAADGWVPGSCPRDTWDTCFAPQPSAIIWAWNGSGDIMSYDPVTGVWTDYGKTVDPATGLVVGGFAMTVRNSTNGSSIFYWIRDCLYESDTVDPVGTFKLVGCDAAAVNSVPCMAFDPSGRLLIGDGRTVQAINPDTGAVLSTAIILDQRKIDANIAVPGTWASEQISAGPGDWHFDPAGDWYMMATDQSGASFGVDTGTVLWKIDPATNIAVRVSNTASPSTGTGSTWLAPGQHLLSGAGGGVRTYKVAEDPVAGSVAAWVSEIPNAPYGINDLASEWQEIEPLRIFGTRCGSDPCADWEWCIVAQDDASGELVTRPFDLTIPGIFGKCDKIKSTFVEDPLDPTSPGAGSDGCAECQQAWTDGCSDAGPTKWRRSVDPATGVATVEYWYGTLAAPTTTAPSGFGPIPCDQRISPSVEIVPICDLDDSTTKYRREETDEFGNVTVSYFDATGTIAEPVNFVTGECPGADPNVTVTDTQWCVNGEAAIRRDTATTVFDIDGIGTTTTVTVWFGSSGPVAAPGPTDSAFIGDCLPPPAPVIKVDIEYFCDTALGTVQQSTTTITDGVPAAPVIVDTGRPCTQDDPIDYEVHRECRGGFVTIVATENGVEVAATSTPEPCQPVNTHLIEGCISDGAGGTVSAFTIIDDTGTPLFPPRPLTTLGFEENCCG